MKRLHCELCESSDLKIIYKIDNFPVRIGVSDSNLNYAYNDFTYAQCQFCNNIQIYDLVDPSIVYLENHNKSIVGKTWHDHNLAFSKFISKHLIENTKIFEIGDPSAKIASLIIENPKIFSWDILEPEADDINIEKINIINGFFDSSFKNENKYDLIVMSHVFEHLIDYQKMIAKMSEIIQDDGKIIISVPNMQYIVDTKSMPPLTLQFEHTIFLNKINIVEIFKKFNFELNEIENFNNHSDFYVFVKKTNLDYNFKNLMPASLADEIISTFNSKIIKLNEFQKEILTGNYDACFIYGAHIQSQMFLKLGLNENNITGVLDNDTYKHNKYLYGYNLKVYPLSVLSNFKNILILCEMGFYSDEIKKQINESFKNVKFI